MDPSDEVIAMLLRDRTAFRQQVVQELMELLQDCPFLGESGKRMIAEKNAPIQAAAARLGLGLSTPPTP